ncbi:sulfite exporter TauE/SafE family protein [Jeotgalibaca sp. MA1X17-3]|uniref:sulfite exporter TauE/SafE family protein n=1 Tax=Jeotgalibaca sp. MA1X17-3 TaxID=2908211 RepID=UPI001F3318B6|nr:sulfite exporter TauE/SafE family protein [Jeotgalibaca sp. MA1X17-3]UJF16137.1 sulfite exporter TauE/SafE family protein [Jeotgalibaca sp. MA1X17-3]
MLGLQGIEIGMLIIAAVIVGFSKAGIQGASIPAVALMAIIFGGKQSVGIMLPMLLVGDLVAIKKYGKQANTKDVLRLLPPTILGVIAGAVLGNQMNDSQFKFLMGIILMVCLILLVFRSRSKEANTLSENTSLRWFVGMISGFSSMVGNAAGPIFSVYILAQNLQKQTMIGTAAWFFFIMNMMKVPFHIFLWKTITFETVKYIVFALPFIGLGAVIGIWVVRHISEHWYRRMIILTTAIASIRLLL